MSTEGRRVSDVFDTGGIAKAALCGHTKMILVVMAMGLVGVAACSLLPLTWRVPGETAFFRVRVVVSPTKRFVVAVLGGLLAACAPPVWEHPTKGMANFERDQSQCVQLAVNEEMAIDPHSGASIPLQARVGECLRARGYIERQR